MATWFIDPGKNEGYPMLDVWPPEWQTGYTSSDTIRYPDYMWRIEAGINEDYPWIYPWFKKSSSDAGDMEHGGSQTNYPNGFTYSDNGGLSDQFDDTDMTDNTALIDTINSIVASAFAGKMLSLDSADFAKIISFLNNPDSSAIADANIIQSLFGANVYDGILLCKCYPFYVIHGDARTLNPSIFGKFKLYDTNPITEPPNYYAATNVIQTYDFGTITPDIMQAWELEHTAFYLYMPYAGTYPIDIRSGETIALKLHVDLLTGVGQYILKQNGQITGLYKIQVGFDMPVNLSQGQLNSNFVSFASNQISRGLSAVSGVASAVNPVAGAVTGAIGEAAQTLAQHFDISSPSVGGNVGNAAYPYPRILAKIPKMFNGGYGYHETLGQNRSTTYVRLSQCSGFVRCKNYKTDIIVATTSEKAEIEQLMDQGVFL